MARLITVLVFVFGTLMAIVVIRGNESLSDGGTEGAGYQTGGDIALFGKGKSAKRCPVSGNEIKAGQGIEAALPDSRKIKLCCPDCVEEAGKDEKKYEPFIY